jgi:hypothetical protein
MMDQQSIGVPGNRFLDGSLVRADSTGESPDDSLAFDLESIRRSVAKALCIQQSVTVAYQVVHSDHEWSLLPRFCHGLGRR